MPGEVIGNTANTVHPTVDAFIVSESAAVMQCAVVVGPRVIVTVVRGEHHTVDEAERIITGVTRVPGHMKCVVCLFRQHQERTVLGRVVVVIST